jgi:hypothetical protein
MQPYTQRDKLLFVIQGVLIAFLAISFFAQNNLGLADNGDYPRFMAPLTSGPIGVEPNWSERDSPQWQRRFFYNWLPYWRLDWPMHKPVTSVALLWLVGAALNLVVYSRDVLWLPLMGLPIKVGLIASIVLMFIWIGRRQPNQSVLLTATLGLPLVLLFSTTDFVVYINTFYREAGSVAYLLAFLAALIHFSERPTSRGRLCLCFGLLLLLTTAKASNVYWPIVGVPVLLGLRRARPIWLLVTASVALSVSLSGAALRLTADDTNRTTAWDSLFSSALLLSNQAESHLLRLKMPGAARCIGAPIFVGVGRDCYAQYGSHVTARDSLSVILREPTVLLRQLMYGMRAMNDLSVEWYGIYPREDPRAAAVPAIEGPMDRRFLGRRSILPLNMWSRLQYQYFPRGGLLMATMVTLGVVCWTGWHGGAFTRKLALLCAVTGAGLVLDVAIQVAGEGSQDLIRHLFMANVLLALSFICAVSIVALTVTRRSVPVDARLGTYGPWVSGQGAYRE